MGGFLQVAVSEAPRLESIHLRIVASRGAPDTALRLVITNSCAGTKQVAPIQERHGDQEQATRPRSISVVEPCRNSESNI